MKRTLALALGVVVPTLLLGVGWLLASLREREALDREQRASLVRAAQVVRGVVDESLDELTKREDERPFYLYFPYYSPEEVLSVTDLIATSPLAARPTDPRVVGYFQIEPGDVVHTPHEMAARDLDRRVIDVVRDASFDEVRRVAEGDTTSSPLVASLRTPPPVAPSDTSTNTNRPRRRQSAPRDEQLANAGTAPPSGPLTTGLNAWSQNVANEIQAAQAGDPEAMENIVQRGRSLPRQNRVDLPLNEALTQQAVPQQQSASQRNDGYAGWENRRRRNVEIEPSPPVPQYPTAGPETDVAYTPLSLVRYGRHVALVRTVAHGGATVVQGLLLDPEAMVDDWIPDLVARHVITDVPRIVGVDTPAECAVRSPVSARLALADMCFSPDLLPQLGDDELRYQIGALALLVLVSGLFVVLVHRASGRAEELARKKSEFVAAVSHELRTPLTTLRMNAEMLRDGLVSEGKRERFLDAMSHEAVRLSRLVENVIEVARLEDGRRPLKLTTDDLVAHVRSIVDAQREFVEAKGFEVAAATREPVVTSFDAQAVEQIVVNLIDNAVKYATGDQRRIDIEVRAEGDAAIVHVLDRGPGVAPELRERVFERFVRGEHDKNRHMPGTGIGLSLVRDLARAHGGDARLCPREGGGLDAQVRLPLRAA